jgi:hypothetical protein
MVRKIKFSMMVKSLFEREMTCGAIMPEGGHLETSSAGSLILGIIRKYAMCVGLFNPFR